MNAVTPRERFLAAPDNLRLYVQDWGDPDWPATPVLCLPGLVRNSRDFALLARRLSDPAASKPRRVIAPDMRGRGRSARDADWRHYNGRTYLDDIRHLLAALGIERVIAVGISMGGLLGIAMATAMPTVLAGVVVDDAGRISARKAAAASWTTSPPTVRRRTGHRRRATCARCSRHCP